jgi:hypothetical protein
MGMTFTILGVVFIFADDGGTARELGNAPKKRAPVNAQWFFEGEGHTFFI